jgi:hypothetical protein
VIIGIAGVPVVELVTGAMVEVWGVAHHWQECQLSCDFGQKAIRPTSTEGAPGYRANTSATDKSTGSSSAKWIVLINSSASGDKPFSEGWFSDFVVCRAAHHGIVARQSHDGVGDWQ